jgi:hypothetical protein
MSNSAKQLAKKQNEILQAMSRIRVMRHGTLSKQTYPERAQRKDGQGAVGPYWIWQGTVEGVRFGKRVSGTQAERLQEGIAQRHAFGALCEEYVDLGCKLADLADAGETEVERIKKGLYSPSSAPRKSPG